METKKIRGGLGKTRAGPNDKTKSSSLNSSDQVQDQNRQDPETKIDKDRENSVRGDKYSTEIEIEIIGMLLSLSLHIVME